MRITVRSHSYRTSVILHCPPLYTCHYHDNSRLYFCHFHIVSKKPLPSLSPLLHHLQVTLLLYPIYLNQISPYNLYLDSFVLPLYKATSPCATSTLPSYVNPPSLAISSSTKLLIDQPQRCLIQHTIKPRYMTQALCDPSRAQCHI